MKKADVAVIMGSQTDYKIMKDAVDILKQFKISYVVKIVSAHRDPKAMVAFTEEVTAAGFKVIIAGAGAAAHLPGMVASLTTLPVIGVPVVVNRLKGIDALLSIAQMPKGIPVATVAIDNATNAGILAARILGTSESAKGRSLQQKLFRFQKEQKLKVRKMNQSLTALLK